MLSVGVDLERIERFTFVQKQRGESFYRKVFTPSEQAACLLNPLRLALWFTAKEAVAKALKTGLALGQPNAVCCTDIEIACQYGIDDPQVTLRGKAIEEARQRGMGAVLLRWYHNGSLACSLAGCVSNPYEADELQCALADSLARVATLMSRMAIKDRRK